MSTAQIESLHEPMYCYMLDYYWPETGKIPEEAVIDQILNNHEESESSHESNKQVFSSRTTCKNAN